MNKFANLQSFAAAAVVAVAGFVVGCNGGSGKAPDAQDSESLGVAKQATVVACSSGDCVVDDIPNGPQCVAAPRNRLCQEGSQAVYFMLQKMAGPGVVNVDKPGMPELTALVASNACSSRVAGAINALGNQALAGTLSFPGTASHSCNGVKFYPAYSTVNAGKTALLALANAVKTATNDNPGDSLWFFAHNFLPGTNYARPSFLISAYPGATQVSVLMDPTDVNTNSTLSGTAGASAAGQLVYGGTPDPNELANIKRTVLYNTSYTGTASTFPGGTYCYADGTTNPINVNTIVSVGSISRISSTKYMCGFQ